MKLSMFEKHGVGYTEPELEPSASQQKDFVAFSPEVDKSSTSSKYKFSHGKLSLQANLIASSVALVPLMPTKEMFSTLTAEGCCCQVVAEMRRLRLMNSKTKKI